MRTLILIILLSSLVSVVQAKPQPQKIVTYKTISEAELALHIFNPPDHQPTDKNPAIVFFFGGGWNGGSIDQFYPQSKYLASRGMLAICADYRVKKRHKTSPKECVKDGKSALRWVRSHSKELGIDPNKIVASGGSAGGHVAAATAILEGFNEEGEDTSISCRPNALVLYNPVFDNGPTGYGYDRVKEYWEDFSPMHNIDKNTPPTIVFLGTRDKLIPVSTAEQYKSRMDAVGARCELMLYEAQPHGFFNQSKSKEMNDKTTIAADKFLISLGYLQGKPTLSKNDSPTVDDSKSRMD